MRIVVHVERGPLAESVHEIEAVVVDSAGRLVLAAGDPERQTCLRSSAKPFQALAAVESGATEAFGFDSAERALMCASHGGEPVHVSTVEGMLRKIGCSECDLECGAHPPLDPASASALAARGEAPRTVHNNCSGKHTGMLALARHLGADTAGYVAADHIVQRTIRRQLEAVTGIRDIPTAVDGCSAVTYYLPLRAVALLFRDLCVGRDGALASLRDSMIEHPHLVGGRDRFDTSLMTALGGAVVSKGGAEALQGVGVRTASGDTYGIAVKALDGASRGSEPAAVALLDRLGVLTGSARAALAPFAAPQRTNHRGTVIGRVRAEVLG